MSFCCRRSPPKSISGRILKLNIKKVTTCHVFQQTVYPFRGTFCRQSVRPSVRGTHLSQGALQRVVFVFKTFELQKVFGPLAALSGGGQVGDLDGGRTAPDGGARQVLRCRLVVLVQTGGAGICFYPEGEQNKVCRTPQMY